MEHSHHVLSEKLREQGRLHMEGGQYEEAEAMLKATLRLTEQNLGELSIETGLVLMDLIDLYDKQGRDTDAQPLWVRLTSIIRKSPAGTLEARKFRNDSHLEQLSSED